MKYTIYSSMYEAIFKMLLLYLLSSWIFLMRDRRFVFLVGGCGGDTRLVLDKAKAFVFCKHKKKIGNCYKAQYASLTSVPSSNIYLIRIHQSFTKKYSNQLERESHTRCEGRPVMIWIHTRARGSEGMLPPPPKKKKKIIKKIIKNTE